MRKVLYGALQDSGDGSAVGICVGLFVLALGLRVIGLWKVFKKANQPGWMSLIPILNYSVLLDIIGRPGWWVWLIFVPFVNGVVSIAVCFELAKSFGKGAGYAVGLLFLWPVFILHLGFSDAEYAGPRAGTRRAWTACPDCRTSFSPEEGACPTCGTQLCPSCHTRVFPDETACPRCGQIFGGECPACGKAVPPDAPECLSCGQTLCPSCGAAIGENDTQCQICGMELALVCSNCDTELTAEMVVCPGCGMRFSESELRTGDQGDA